MRTIMEYELPADGKWHELSTIGAVVHLEALTVGMLTLYAIGDTRWIPGVWQYGAFTTGDVAHLAGVRYVGSVRFDGTVFHVLQRRRPGEEEIELEQASAQLVEMDRPLLRAVST